MTREEFFRSNEAAVSLLFCEKNMREFYGLSEGIRETFPVPSRAADDAHMVRWVHDMRPWVCRASKTGSMRDCTNILSAEAMDLKRDADGFVMSVRVKYHVEHRYALVFQAQGSPCVERGYPQGGTVPNVSLRVSTEQGLDPSFWRTHTLPDVVTVHLDYTVGVRFSTGGSSCKVSVMASGVSVLHERVRASCVNPECLFVYTKDSRVRGNAWGFRSDALPGLKRGVYAAGDLSECAVCRAVAVRIHGAAPEGWVTLRNGNCECPSCAEARAVECPSCGGWFDVCGSDWNSDRGECADCAAEGSDCSALSDDDDEDGLIHDYHCAPPLHFFGVHMHSGREVQGWHIGHEVEVGGASRSCGEKCRFNNETADLILHTEGVASDVPEVFFETDGSVPGGFEIITQPHTEETDSALPWEKWCEVLKNRGFKSYRFGEDEGGYCGHHIHVGWRWLGTDRAAQTESLARIYILFDYFWHELIKASGRKRVRYCGRVEVLHTGSGSREEQSRTAGLPVCAFGKADGAHVVPADSDDLRGVQWVDIPETYRAAHRKADFRSGDHGVCLNAHSRSTFEFRLGRGTLNPQSLRAWTDLCLRFCDNARAMREPWEAFSADKWLRGISEDTKEYLVRKGAFLFADCIREKAVSLGASLDASGLNTSLIAAVSEL